MDLGVHIPAYLFCEQFVENAVVLDLYPRAEQATRVLAERTRAIINVHPSKVATRANSGNSVCDVVAQTNYLPFASSSVDIIFYSPRDEALNPDQIEHFLRASRSLLRPTGLLVLVVPNRDAVAIDGKQNPLAPGFFDLERLLRRHFPHITILAQRPLHGAILTPLSRTTSAQAPILEDRLLPEEGEQPSHYLALCSPKYRNVADAMIAQLPFEMLRSSVQFRIDELAGRMKVALSESETRGREIERLQARIEETMQKAEEAEILKRENALNLSRIADLERQLVARDGLLRQSEEIEGRQARRITEAEQQLFDLKRKIRQAEQTSAQLQQNLEMTIKERDDFEEERERLLDGLRTARAELKSKQRELDDLREEIAGREADLTELRNESSRHRREAVAARELANRLETELKILEEMQVEASNFQAELAEVRLLAAQERQRLERRIEEEQDKLALEKSARLSADERAEAMRQQMEEIRRSAEDAIQSQADELKRQQTQMALLAEQVDTVQIELEKSVSQSSTLEQKLLFVRGEEEIERQQITDLEKALDDSLRERQELEEKIERLVTEKEAEVLKVTDDLEKELRLAVAEVENRGGEIWELKEEILRLRAHIAATAAASEQNGKGADLQRALADQEALIVKLTVERDDLREKCRRFKRKIEKKD